MFPDNWEAVNCPVKKKHKTFVQKVDEDCLSSKIPYTSNLSSLIERTLSSTPERRAELKLDLDHILSKVHYQQMLENVFPSSAGDASKVPIISKSFEESYLRQPMAGEQACAMADRCECMFVDPNAPFTAVEFRLPGDPETPQMCVLCSRRTTQKAFYDMCYAEKSPSCVIQRYGNLFGIEGEYSPEYMLVCPSNINIETMPLPVMSHQRNRYSVKAHGGVKWIEQHRVAFKPELRIKPLRHGLVCTRLPPFPPEGELDDPSPLLPRSPSVSKRLHAIHEWARLGDIDNSTAERYINTYLAVPGLPAGLLRLSERFAMPLADSPHFDNLPDLWPVLRDVMTDVHRDGLEFHFISQALPCFRKTNRLMPGAACCSVIFCLIMALLLGLYPDAIRKPRFLSRASFFKRIHVLMTGDAESQTRFVQEHPQLAILAVMEYLARVIRLFYPVEEDVLVNVLGISQFFEKIPVLCDEFRALNGDEAWDQIEALASAITEKSPRIRNKLAQAEKTHTERLSERDLMRALQCPYLLSPTKDDNLMLAHSYGIRACVLSKVHSLVRVHDLPSCIAEVQRASLRENVNNPMAAWMRSRLYCCMSCLAQKAVLEKDFKADILSSRLVCEKCRSANVICVDLLGRVAFIMRKNYVFCPACVSVHEYSASSGAWPLRCCRPAQERVAPPLAACCVCQETHQVTGFERVSHLTGGLETLFYCARHQPKPDLAALAVNVRQLIQLESLRKSRFA